MDDVRILEALAHISSRVAAVRNLAVFTTRTLHQLVPQAVEGHLAAGEELQAEILSGQVEGGAEALEILEEELDMLRDAICQSRGLRRAVSKA